MVHVRRRRRPADARRRRGGRRLLTSGLVRAAAAAVAVALLFGCGTSATSRPRVRVLAAQSLADALPQVARIHERTTDTEVEASFAGTPSLVAQIREGAPADVFVSADAASMQAVVDEGLARGEPVLVAHNTLAIVVPPGNPAGVTDLADLARPDLVIALGAPDVPGGVSARDALRRARVVVEPDTLEPSIAGIIAKVELGEVDAGIVYASDGRGREVELIPITHDGVTVDYLAVVLRSASDPASATAFVDTLSSRAGQDALRAAGLVPVARR